MADGVADGGGGGRRRLLAVVPWVVVGVVMVVLAAVAVVRLFMTDDEEPGAAVTVGDVADLAVEVTEGLDVAGGVGLLCEPPMDLYRMTVDATIVRWQAQSGTAAPEVEAQVSDVDEGPSGSFVIVITSPDEALADVEQDFRVFVESREGRSCVTGVGAAGAERPTTRFSRGGYSRVTSPPPSPRTTAP